MQSWLFRAGSVICFLVITFFSCSTSFVLAAETTESLNKYVVASVRSTLTELNDFRPGYLYLTVENQSDNELTIEKIVLAERPAFISIKSSALVKDSILCSKSDLPRSVNVSLPAHESLVYPLYVSSTGQVRPGDHMLLFNVFFRQNINGKEQSGSVFAEHKFKVMVFGENQILGALSNTVTFLIFPGIIITVLAGLTWKAFVPSPWKEKYPEYMKGSTITDIRFLVIAVTVSLLMVWQGYPLLTQYFTKIGRRDYLYGYGFLDIVRMWLFSVIIGTMISLIVAFFVWLWQKFIQLKVNDQPVSLLRKMLRNGMNSVVLQRITVTASKEKGFLIESVSSASKEFLIIPYIEVLWQQNADKLIQEFNMKINGDSPSTLRSVLETLNKGLKQKEEGSGLYAASWLPLEGYIKAPQIIEEENIVVDSEKECVIRSKVE